VTSGRLVRIHAGVYAFGHLTLTRDGWWHAALLVAGPTGVITARACCSIWNVLPVEHGPVDIIAERRRGTTAPWLRVRRVSINEDEVTVRRGLRVTTPARAIVDLADLGSAHDVGTALDQCLRLGLFDRHVFDQAIDRASGRRGLKLLRPAMARLSGDTFLSMTERRVRDELLDTDLPRPRVNEFIPRPGGLPIRVDLLWVEERLVVELDGPQHQLPYQQEIDRERDAYLRRAGYRVLRYPVERLDRDIAGVIAETRAELRGHPGTSSI